MAGHELGWVSLNLPQETHFLILHVLVNLTLVGLGWLYLGSRPTYTTIFCTRQKLFSRLVLIEFAHIFNAARSCIGSHSGSAFLS